MDKRAPKPYLHDYYNIKGYFYTASWVTSATSRILNKLIEALNENDKLPKMLIFVMNKDIISDLKDFNFGATKNLANIVNWLTRQCKIAIRQKKLQILKRKPGASISDKFPIIMYTTMIRRAEMYLRNSKIAQICSLRSKFNEILHEIAAKQDSKIININSCATLDDFDRMGNLSIT